MKWIRLWSMEQQLLRNNGQPGHMWMLRSTQPFTGCVLTVVFCVILVLTLDTRAFGAVASSLVAAVPMYPQDIGRQIAIIEQRAGEIREVDSETIHERITEVLPRTSSLLDQYEESSFAEGSSDGVDVIKKSRGRRFIARMRRWGSIMKERLRRFGSRLSRWIQRLVFRRVEAHGPPKIHVLDQQIEPNQVGISNASNVLSDKDENKSEEIPGLQKIDRLLNKKPGSRKFWYSTSKDDADLALDAVKHIIRLSVKQGRKPDLYEPSFVLDKWMPMNKPVKLSSAHRQVYLERKRILGTGGFGNVYEVEDEAKNKYAVKTYKLSRDASTNHIIMTLDRETHILTQLPPLQHPTELFYTHRIVLPNEALRFDSPDTVLTSRDSGHFLLNAILVMPLVQHELTTIFPSMMNNFSRTRNLVRLSIIEQVMRILAGVHDLGIVHADLKSQNLMLNDDGYVYLVDFGISKRMGSYYPCEFHTVLYISPELAKCVIGAKSSLLHTARPFRRNETDPDSQKVGAVFLDSTADSWTLGHLIYFLWCHNAPYNLKSNSDFQEFRRSVINAVWSSNFAKDCHPTMPHRLKSMVESLMKHDSTSRSRISSFLSPVPLTSEVDNADVIPVDE